MIVERLINDSYTIVKG